MLYFFHGPDTYTLLEELKKLKAKFKANIEELEISPEYSDKSLRSRLQELLESQGLFAGKKLVILRNFVGEVSKYPKSEEYLSRLINQHATSSTPIHGLTLLFIQTQDFDGRLSFFKTLRKTVHLKEFSHPAGQALETWIKKYLDKRGLKMEKQALNKLIELLGEDYDLWQVVNELEKLMLYETPSPPPPIPPFDRLRAGQGEKAQKASFSPFSKGENKRGFSSSQEGGVITAGAVKQIVPRSLEKNVFTLTNLFAEGKTAAAVKFLEQLVGRGPTAELKKQAIQIVGALASQIRSLLLVKDLEIESPDEIAKILEWKAGRVWINLRLAKRFSPESLKQMLKDLKQIDFRLKTSEEPPKLLLTLFLQKAKA